MRRLRSYKRHPTYRTPFTWRLDANSKTTLQLFRLVNFGPVVPVCWRRWWQRVLAATPHAAHSCRFIVRFGLGSMFVVPHSETVCCCERTHFCRHTSGWAQSIFRLALFGSNSKKRLRRRRRRRRLFARHDIFVVVVKFDLCPGLGNTTAHTTNNNGVE